MTTMRFIRYCGCARDVACEHVIGAAATLSDPGDPRRLTSVQAKDIELLAGAIKSQVARFSDRHLNDGDDVWRERELTRRETVAETANAICEALQLDVASFAAACGLYVSDGFDNYSDCRSGKLTWEKKTP